MIAFISSGINDTQVNSMYMNSPGHRANILGSYNYVATAWVIAPNGYAFNAEEFLNAPVGKVLWKENVLNKLISANDTPRNLIGRSIKQRSEVETCISLEYQIPE